MTYRAMIGNKPVQTKKELKEAVAQGEIHLWFRNYNLLGFTDDVSANNFPPSLKVDVVGPDPERDRKWYATVQTKNGKLMVT